ncbi:hypothetical protein Q8A67_022200 [Cirrhinus molitorella]|uniref:Snake toxin/toxin-like domain-containing protein n=1 Tax=Cirrhinus molitorella TaxID=172907 RepID=A0AA88PF95_9TELE|nr:hypothetical protein Q8A67_022200 [Cirrhinus molitorella]
MHLRVSIVLLFVLLTGGFCLVCYDCWDQHEGPCEEQITCDAVHEKCTSRRQVEYYAQATGGNHLLSSAATPTCAMNKLAQIRKRSIACSCSFHHKMHLQVSISSASLLFILLTGEFSLDCYNCKDQRGGPCEERIIFLSSTSPKPNEKKCFTCDDEGCSKIMSCWGDENQCFTTKANETLKAVKGCASKSACDRVLGHVLESYGNITCCWGNLCNGAESVTQSFLFLCCSLLSFILLQ